MAIDTPQFRNADTMAGGRLERILAELVASGRSPEHISRVLYAEHRIEVSRQTVVRWIGLLGIPDPGYQLPESTEVDDQPEPNGDTEPEARAS